MPYFSQKTKCLFAENEVKKDARKFWFLKMLYFVEKPSTIRSMTVNVNQHRKSDNNRNITWEL